MEVYYLQEQELEHYQWLHLEVVQVTHFLFLQEQQHHQDLMEVIYGSGDGGVTQIYAGLGGGSGATGDVELWGKVGAVAIPTLIVKGNTSKVSIQSGGATSVTPDGTLEVNQQDTGGGIPCLVLDQDDVDYAFLRLDGSAGSGTAYNLDTEPAGDTSGSTVAAPHSAAWVVVGMVKILVGTDVRYLPYYSKV